MSNLHCKVPLQSACSPLKSGSMEKTYSPRCFPHPFEVLLMSEGAIQTSGHDTAELKADEALHPKIYMFILFDSPWMISHVSLLTCFCYHLQIQVQKSNRMHIAHSNVFQSRIGTYGILLQTWTSLCSNIGNLWKPWSCGKVDPPLSWIFRGTKLLNFVHQTLIIQLWWKVHHGPWPVRVFTDRYGTLKKSTVGKYLSPKWSKWSPLPGKSSWDHPKCQNNTFPAMICQSVVLDLYAYLSETHI